jgi:hypothetical protein
VSFRPAGGGRRRVGRHSRFAAVRGSVQVAGVALLAVSRHYWRTGAGAVGSSRGTRHRVRLRRAGSSRIQQLSTRRGEKYEEPVQEFRS